MILFSFWLYPVRGSRFIHLTTVDSDLFVFYGWAMFHCIYMYHTFSIHSSVDGRSGCFHTRTAFLVYQFTLTLGFPLKFRDTLYFPLLMLWAESCPPDSYVEVLIPSTSEYDCLGRKAFKEVIKLYKVICIRHQHDWCPYKKRLGHRHLQSVWWQEEASGESSAASVLILDFWPLEM